MFEFAITTRAKNVVKPPLSTAGHIFDKLVCALFTFVPVKICKILYCCNNQDGKDNTDRERLRTFDAIFYYLWLLKTNGQYGQDNQYKDRPIDIYQLMRKDPM